MKNIMMKAQFQTALFNNPSKTLNMVKDSKRVFKKQLSKYSLNHPQLALNKLFSAYITLHPNDSLYHFELLSFTNLNWLKKHLKTMAKKYSPNSYQSIKSNMSKFHRKHPNDKWCSYDRLTGRFFEVMPAMAQSAVEDLL